MQVLDKTQVEAVSKALGEPAWLLEKRLKALGPSPGSLTPARRTRTGGTPTSPKPPGASRGGPQGAKAFPGRPPRAREAPPGADGRLGLPGLRGAGPRLRRGARGAKGEGPRLHLPGRGPEDPPRQGGGGPLPGGLHRGQVRRTEQRLLHPRGLPLRARGAGGGEAPRGLQGAPGGEKASAGRSLLFLEDNAKAAYIEEYLSLDLPPPCTSPPRRWS